MIRGETVSVEVRSEVGRDSMNASVYESRMEEVRDVVVAPGSSADIGGSTRPDGDSARLTLHFPKDFDRPMRGLRVDVRGEAYVVVGDPKPYTPENVPGRWWYPVEVVRCDG